MSNISTIEWTDASWNPVTGCTEVSPGCDHCYAKAMAERFRGSKAFPSGFDLTFHPERLQLPLKWKPQMIFVNSMSDLFHKDIPDAYILQVFEVMFKAKQHIFQVLTKRPSRLALMASTIIHHISLVNQAYTPWPAHIWLGVSVESQQYTWRIDKLRSVPTPIRFISAEPLLGPLDLDLSGISWVITGCESGRGARLMNEDWVRELRDQCIFSDTRFFYKQKLVNGKKVGLPELDGKVWNEFPSLKSEATS